MNKDIQALKQEYFKLVRRLDELREERRRLISARRGFNISNDEFHRRYQEITSKETKLTAKIRETELKIKVAEIKELLENNKFTTAFWRQPSRALPSTIPRGKPFILRQKIRLPCNHTIDLLDYALHLEEPHRSLFLDRIYRSFTEPRHGTFGCIELLISCPKCQQKHILVLELRQLPENWETEQ
mgnify:CR=1 FL=1